jgi:DNA-binding transcriptional regulator LsrR (DeoR family)
VPLAGSGSGLVNGANPHELALTLARKARGRAFHLPAPLLARSPDAARASYADPGVIDVLALAGKADILLAGLGGTTRGEGLLLGALDEAERDELVASGAVGDLAGRFFDANGAAVESELDTRIVGLTLEQMLAIPHRVGIARGATKIEALRAALTGGLVNMLVTDSETAAALLA